MESEPDVEEVDSDQDLETETDVATEGESEPEPEPEPEIKVVKSVIDSKNKLQSEDSDEETKDEEADVNSEQKAGLGSVDLDDITYHAADDEKVELPLECGVYSKDDFTADNRTATANLKRKHMSVPWFRNIKMNPDELEKVCFSESLLMVDEFGKVAGKMNTSVSQAKWGDKQCLCVHSGSYGALPGGLECGTTITGFVSHDMKPVQEYVYEWVLIDGKIIERKTFIIGEDGSIQIRFVSIQDGQTVEAKPINLGKLELQDIVTESSNIVLLRLLMIQGRTVGQMDLKTITFTGKVAKNKYVELGEGWENVKGQPTRTWSIRRTVEFDFGDRLWDSIFNQFGRLVLRCQPENTHALIPLWFEPAMETKNGKVRVNYPPYIWACDAELHAKYLLKKDKLSSEHKSYLLDHPELRALLSDFMQALLLRKPAHAIPFAQQYFESFLALRPETDNTSTMLSSTTNVSGSVTGTSVQEEQSVSGYGEWTGESDNEVDYTNMLANKLRYYKVFPTIDDGGLERVGSSEELSVGHKLHSGHEHSN